MEILGHIYPVLVRWKQAPALAVSQDVDIKLSDNPLTHLWAYSYENMYQNKTYYKPALFIILRAQKQPKFTSNVEQIQGSKHAQYRSQQQMTYGCMLQHE